MKKSIRLIIVVAVVGLTIGGFFIVKNLPEKERESSFTPSERYELIDSRETEMESMKFERNDGTTLLFEKVETGEGDDKQLKWMLTSPKVLYEPRERDIRDIAYSMSGVSGTQIIEESPTDLSIYGLDTPSAKATIGFTDGTSATVIAGNPTPTRNSYYAQLVGDPKVYTVRTYTIDRFFSDPMDMRDRDIPFPNTQEITYFRLEGEEIIEIVKMDEDDNFIGSQFSSMKISKPYVPERSLDTQRFSEMLEVVPQGAVIERFVDDAPTDLSVYGLNPPKYTWIMRDSETFIHLLIGDDAGEGQVYAKLPDEETVFTLAASVLPFLSTKAFTLADKFVLIPNIDYVDTFTVVGFDKEYNGEIKREKNLSAQEGEDEDVLTTYFLDGKEIEEDPFKKFYQLVIGLLMDAENPDPAPYSTPDVTISYNLNDNAPVEYASVDFVKLDHDFYAVYQNKTTEFLLSTYQINAIFDRAAELVAD